MTGPSYRPLLAATVAYTIILELMLVAGILFFPNFEEHFDTLKMLTGIPALEGIMRQIEEGGVVAYVVGQHFFKGCNTLGTAAAVLLASGAVAGEVHRGTLELWLARPYSRAQLLSERFFTGALAVVVPVLVTSATIPALCDLIGEQVELAPMMLCAVHQCAMLLAIYGLAFLISAMGSNPMKIALGLLFAFLFSFSIYLIEVVSDYSIYRWTDIEVFMRVCDERSLPLGMLFTLLGLTLAFYGGSILALHRRVP